MAHFMYGVAKNTGKGFFTANDRRKFFLRGYTGHDGTDYVDVWAIGNNVDGATWLADRAGTEKTKSEAQTLVTAAVTLAQTAWDDDNVDGETDAEKEARLGARPGAVSVV